MRNTMHKKDLKFALVAELVQLKFTYLYHNTKIAKARPHRVECPKDSSVQKQCTLQIRVMARFFSKVQLGLKMKVLT